MSLRNKEFGWTMTAGFGIATIALFRAYRLIGLFILADSAWTGSWVEERRERVALGVNGSELMI